MYTGVGGGWNFDKADNRGDFSKVLFYFNRLICCLNVDKSVHEMGLAVYPVFHRPYMLPPPFYRNPLYRVEGNIG